LTPSKNLAVTLSEFKKAKRNPRQFERIFKKGLSSFLGSPSQEYQKGPFADTRRYRACSSASVALIDAFSLVRAFPAVVAPLDPAVLHCLLYGRMLIYRFFVLNLVEHYWLSSFAGVLDFFISVRSHRAILSGRVRITVGNLSFSADQKLHPSDNPRNYGSNQGYIQRNHQKPDGSLCV